MLSTVLNIIIFEDCRNQWSMSRPLLGLILLNEKVNISPRPLKRCACVWYNTSILCIPAVFCWSEEQHRQQPATGEAAGHALMFRELDGGNREEPTNKEPRQVGCKIKITGRAVGGLNKARADSIKTFSLVMANSLFKLFPLYINSITKWFCESKPIMSMPYVGLIYQLSFTLESSINLRKRIN